MRMIDADFVLDGIRYIVKDSNEMITSSVVRNAMILLVDRAKTVDAEPVRHGEWIRDTDHHWDSKFKCSRCEYETDVDTCFGKPLYNYCPYCGARMGEERKNDAID